MKKQAASSASTSGRRNTAPMGSAVLPASTFISVSNRALPSSSSRIVRQIHSSAATGSKSSMAPMPITLAMKPTEPHMRTRP